MLYEVITVLADVVHLAELGGDVLVTQVADVEVEVLAVGGLHALALAHVVGHPAGDHVARGQLGLFGLSYNFV